MIAAPGKQPSLERRLAEAEAVIDALLAGQIDAVVDTKSNTPLLVAKAQEELRVNQRHLRDIIDVGARNFAGCKSDGFDRVNSPLDAPVSILRRAWEAVRRNSWWSGSEEWSTATRSDGKLRCRESSLYACPHTRRTAPQ